MSFGFGHGPFGRDAFGEANWSRWLYEALPELYLGADEDQGFVLEKWQESLRGPLDIFRRKIREWLDLRDPLRVRTQYDEVSRLRLGPRIYPTFAAEQRGVDGQIDVTRAFIARSARFKPQDIGKELTFSESAIPTNNVTVRIAAYLSVRSVITDPQLSVDAGPLRWELRKALPVDQEIITLEVRGGDVGSITPGWRLTDGASSFEIYARRRFRNRFAERRLLTDKEGADGFIDVTGRLHSASAGFTQRDVGRPVSITESAVFDNNKIFEIKKIISSSIVELTEPALEDAGLFHWAFFPFPIIEILGPAVPRGVVEQEGQLLQAIAPNILKSVEARFSTRDIGKRISVRGSALSNDGIYEIASILDGNRVTVTVATLVNEAAILFWELRAGSIIGDLTQVEANAPSMITHLAQDFGLEIDTQEVEKRQRAWVQHVTVWIDGKGVDMAYKTVAEITGFLVTVTQLFGVSLDLSTIIPVDTLYIVTDGTAGTYGTDGAFQAGTGGRARLFSPTAAFVASNAGRLIRVSGSPPNANDKIYQIETVISAQIVEFRSADVATLPDARVLTWEMVDIFTTLPPTQPLFDEINVDLMVAEKGPVAFHLDIFCWDANYDTDIPLVVTAVSSIGLNAWNVTVTGVANVVVATGHWEIEDLDGVAFRLESVPTGGGPWTFRVDASEPPALGAATLRYICPVAISCDYCPSNRVLLSLVADDILNDTGVSLERIYERVLTRLSTEVKPHPVKFVQEIEINFGLNFMDEEPTVEQTLP